MYKLSFTRNSLQKKESSNEGGSLMEEKTKRTIELPLIPLRGLSVFPYMVLHFDVGREKSIKALEEAMVKDQTIFLTTQKEIDVDLPTYEDFYEIGTISKIKQMLKLPGDAIRVLVEGIERSKTKKIEKEKILFGKVKSFNESKIALAKVYPMPRIWVSPTRIFFSPGMSFPTILTMC